MMVENVTDLVSLPSRLQKWATQRPGRSAITFVPDSGPHQTISWGKLEAHTNQLARLLLQKGVGNRSCVAIGLPNRPEHILMSIAAWKVGAMVLPIRHATPVPERNQILALAEPTLVVADWSHIEHPRLSLEEFAGAGNFSADPLPDIIAFPGRALASGGSTGQPKLIVENAPFGFPEDLPLFSELKLLPHMVQLVSGALYHAAPFAWMYMGLFQGHTLVLTSRFDPAQVVDLIEHYRVSYAYMAPIMMNRLSRVPDIQQRDLSSLDCLIHMAAPCPPWLKQQWIDLIGPEHLLEVYAATEVGIVTSIWGHDWLTHPNSVGRALSNYELVILNANKQKVPSGEVGEIYIRRTDKDLAFRYVGSPPAKRAGSFVSIGDLGRMDEHGYLYIADRRVDMIITGGANVFPAEVEAALAEHAQVGDVAVIGLPDAEWGRRIHAVVEPINPDTPPSVAELDAHCRERLMAYKRPKTYDFVARLPRNAAGKIRRLDLIAERDQ